MQPDTIGKSFFKTTYICYKGNNPVQCDQMNDFFQYFATYDTTSQSFVSEQELPNVGRIILRNVYWKYAKMRPEFNLVDHIDVKWDQCDQIGRFIGLCATF